MITTIRKEANQFLTSPFAADCIIASMLLLEVIPTTRMPSALVEGSKSLEARLLLNSAWVLNSWIRFASLSCSTLDSSFVCCAYVNTCFRTTSSLSQNMFSSRKPCQSCSNLITEGKVKLLNKVLSIVEHTKLVVTRHTSAYIK